MTNTTEIDPDTFLSVSGLYRRVDVSTLPLSVRHLSVLPSNSNEIVDSLQQDLGVTKDSSLPQTIIEWLAIAVNQNTTPKQLKGMYIHTKNWFGRDIREPHLEYLHMQLLVEVTSHPNISDKFFDDLLRVTAPFNNIGRNPKFTRNCLGVLYSDARRHSYHGVLSQPTKWRYMFRCNHVTSDDLSVWLDFILGLETNDYSDGALKPSTMLEIFDSFAAHHAAPSTSLEKCVHWIVDNTPDIHGFRARQDNLLRLIQHPNNSPEFVTFARNKLFDATGMDSFLYPGVSELFIF